MVSEIIDFQHTVYRLFSIVSFDKRLVSKYATIILQTPAGEGEKVEE